MTAAAADYRFRTVWSLAQPPEPVWAALENPATWPRWWPGCLIVEPHGEVQGAPSGRCYRFHWRGPLPYRLVLDVCITDVEPPQRMGGSVDGVLTGTADWTVAGQAGITKVTFDFAVSARRRWLRHLAPLARPAFRWNHERLMAQGEAGLLRWLSEGRDARAGNLQPGTG